MTDSIIPPAGRYEAEHFDDRRMGGTVASKYSEETKASAIQQVLVEGRPHKEVAQAAGVSVTTLRRWLKETPAAAVPEAIRLVILDSERIHEKLARILHNEGFSPRVDPLRGHILSGALPEEPAWLDWAWLFELPPAGAQRLVDLIERSGKDIPIACLDAAGSPEYGERLDHELVGYGALDGAAAVCRTLRRLYARLQQRAQLRTCQQAFDQLQRCCLRAFDSTPNPVAIVRADGHTYANPAYVRLFGVADFTALQTTDFADLLAESERAAMATPFTAALEQGQAGTLDVVLRNGLRVQAELAPFPGMSRVVQVILQPYAQAPVARTGQTAAPAQATTGDPRNDDEQTLWERRIRLALRERHLFSIVYQPIVNLGGASEACYEALLRLHDEQGGEYLPASFLPAAERAGLMGVVDQWVIRQAARQVQNEAAAGRAVRVFVNLSRETLLNAEFAAWLARLLEHVHIAAEALVFEVPESVLMLHLQACRTTLQALRALGCGIALDHFGGGAEAFAQLADLAVDYLKFSAGLTQGLADHRDNQLRLREFATRARALNIRTIVGRVQDARSVALLWQSGIDYVQGYFLQQPSKALDYDFVNGDYEVATSNPSVF